jgi:hypothetical protein
MPLAGVSVRDFSIQLAENIPLRGLISGSKFQKQETLLQIGFLRWLQGGASSVNQ